jgi:hypothetical protein
VTTRLVLALCLAAAVATTAFAQRGGFGGFRRAAYSDNTRYDGKFVFVRMSYPETRFRGQPFWAHDYPDGEIHFMKILTAVSNIPAHVEETNILDFGDPEMFKFPVTYLVEPGYWEMDDAQVLALRSYLLKGGFLIVDDFPYWAWQQFEFQMGRVFPDGQWQDLDVSHPIFHAFFDIQTLDIVPAYPALGDRPIFRAMFQDNDPEKRMYVIANYQNDLSEFWEFSEQGAYPIAETNEAYKVGVNQFIYGLTH